MLYYKKDTLINYCIVYGYFFDTETELSRCDRNYVLHCQTYLLFGHCQKSLLTPDSEEFNSDKPGLVQWPKNNMEEKVVGFLREECKELDSHSWFYYILC